MSINAMPVSNKSCDVCRYPQGGGISFNERERDTKTPFCICTDCLIKSVAKAVESGLVKPVSLDKQDE